MARQYKCISGDGHIDLNPDIWRDRVQAKYRERAPKRVKMANGSDAVVIDGGKPNTIGITRSVRVAHTDLAKQVPTFEACAGTGSSQQRLDEQVQDGIDGEILTYAYIEDSKIITGAVRHLARSIGFQARESL
jgi:hypothetical protein